MFSVAPNIVLVPNMTQNANTGRKTQTQLLSDLGPNSFNFMQFLRNFGKIICWRPPGELAPPPRGNPRSATEIDP